MSAVEQLPVELAVNSVDPQDLHRFAFAHATALSESIMGFGTGKDTEFKDQQLVLRNPFNQAVDSALLSILEIEATQVDENEDGSVVVFVIEDAFVFREHEFRVGIGRVATYTAYIDCA